MIIEKLIVISLKAKEILKEYTFNTYGLNIILGVKKDGNEESNGVGKTAMIESIRYLLGSSIPNDFQDNSILIEKDIFLVLQVRVNNKEIYLGRRIVDKNVGYHIESYDINLNINEWISLEDEDYKQYIHNSIFLNIKEENMPTFAALREYVIRDEKKGFEDIVLSNRGAEGIYKNLAFLSQLPWTFEQEIKKLKDLQRELNNELSIVNNIGKEITSLKMAEKKVRNELSKLNEILTTFDFSNKIDFDEQKYRNAKQKLKQIQKTIFELDHIKRQYEKNIIDLKNKSLKLEAMNDLQGFYNQMMGYFPEQIQKNIDQVNDFYHFMVNNRGKHFESRIDDINNKLKLLYNEQKDLKEIINQSSKILNTTELVEDINNITDEIKVKSEELAEVSVKIKMYNQKNTINSKINSIKQQIIEINSKNEEELEKYKDLIDTLENTFENLTNIAYGEEGILEYEYDNRTSLNIPTGRIKIKCSIDAESSHGRLYMKINMFDLTWFINRVDMNVDMQFLFHDGSYCKPDKSVKEKILDYINAYLVEKQRGQYFITINVDEMNQEKIEAFKLQGNVVAELNREDGHVNRFFGFKY